MKELLSVDSAYLERKIMVTLLETDISKESFKVTNMVMSQDCAKDLLKKLQNPYLGLVEKPDAKATSPEST